MGTPAPVKQVAWRIKGSGGVSSFSARIQARDLLVKTSTNETLELDGEEDDELVKQITADFAAINCKFEDTRSASSFKPYPLNLKV